MQSGSEQLKEWMERRDWTARETAERWGWDETFISKIVRGHRRPGLGNALKIEEHTGIPVRAWKSSEVDKSESRKVGSSKKPNKTK